MPDRVVEELSAHLARTGRTDAEDLVPGAGRRPGAGHQLPQPRPRPCRAPGRPGGLSFHRLRHSAGHMLRELGVPLEVIQKRLGHSSIRTTADIYGSLPERVDRPVAEKLDEMFRAAPDAGSRGATANFCGADVVQAPGEGAVSRGDMPPDQGFFWWR